MTSRGLLSRTALCAAALTAVVSAAAGLSALNCLRAEYGAMDAAARESAALLSAAGSREATLEKYEGLLRGAPSAPASPESANKFYSALLDAVSANGLERAKVSGVSVRGGEALFSVAGSAEYRRLRKFLASLRSFPYAARLSKLTIEGTPSGEVAFSVDISATVGEDGVAGR